jgi:hypothetical protein
MKFRLTRRISAEYESSLHFLFASVCRGLIVSVGRFWTGRLAIALRIVRGNFVVLSPTSILLRRGTTSPSSYENIWLGQHHRYLGARLNALGSSRLHGNMLHLQLVTSQI